MKSAIALLFLVRSTAAYNNGVMQKPPMGWQTWCSVGPCGVDHCFDGQIRAMADTLVKSGMKDLGYDHIVLDDCWHPSRDEKTGELVPFARFFPDGMVPVIDYLHNLGIKFGLYTSVGDVTCHGGWSPGSLGHFKQDANTFAKWGVDYVKVDYCGKGDDPSGHQNLSKAMNATGRPMALELCRGPYQNEDHWGYAPEYAQGWRATGDHHDEFSSVIQQVNAVKGKGSWSGPYGYAYLDMMMTGGQGCESQGTGGKGESGHWNWTVPEHCPGMTDAQYRTEASLYVIVSSPMMIGTDLRLMTPIMKELLLNEEAIAINQDYMATPGDAVEACTNSVFAAAPSPPAPAVCSVTLGTQVSKSHCTAGATFGCTNGTDTMWVTDGCRGVFTCNGVENVHCGHDGDRASHCACTSGPGPSPPSGLDGDVWVRKLTNGNFAVAVPNWGNAAAELSFCLDSIGWTGGATANVRNVWNKTDLGVVHGKYTATVAAGDTLLLTLSK
eukprot:gene15301-16152_t